MTTLFDAPNAAASVSSGSMLTAHCDGGSRGNPGPAGFGAVVQDETGATIARLSEFLGKRTNNYAEYCGLIAVLRWTVENGHQRLRVIADSELMVKQMQGKYRVNSPDLKPLWEEAKGLARQLAKFEIQHTLRGGNKEADALANAAMDKGMGRVPAPVAAAPAGAARPVAAAPKPKLAAAVELEGFVQDGVVHFLGDKLPDGCFVRIVRK